MPFPPISRVATAFLLAAVVAAAPAGAFKRTFKGEGLKDFTLPSLAGEPLRLSSQLGEKATVVLFWASWSPRSAEALGEFQELYAEHSTTGLQVVAVNVEHQDLTLEQRDLLRTFVATKQLSYPVLVDEGLAVFDRYGVIAVPSLVLADPEGAVVELLEGYSNMTRCEFRDRVLETLGVLAPREEVSAAEVSAYCPMGKSARYYQMGELFLRKKMPRRAVKALRRAVKEDPKYAEAYVRLAEALELKGDAAAAAEARQQATGLGMAPPPLAASPVSVSPVDSSVPVRVEVRERAVATGGGDASTGAAAVIPAASRDGGGEEEEKP